MIREAGTYRLMNDRPVVIYEINSNARFGEFETKLSLGGKRAGKRQASVEKYVRN